VVSCDFGIADACARQSEGRAHVNSRITCWPDEPGKGADLAIAAARAAGRPLILAAKCGEPTKQELLAKAGCLLGRTSILLKDPLVAPQNELRRPPRPRAAPRPLGSEGLGLRHEPGVVDAGQ
jgi:hypothetical protein